MDIQALVNALGAAHRNSRKSYHLSLGRLIEELAAADPSDAIVLDSGGIPGDPISYRGYYEDLAFTPDEGDLTAGEFLKTCRSALGETFTGYKGGDFVMGKDTPLWIANYGQSSAAAVIGIARTDGRLVLVTKQVED